MKEISNSIRAAGLKENFNRKGGGYNGEKPTEGVGRVALLYTVDLPGEASGWRGLFRKLVAGRRRFTFDLLRSVNFKLKQDPPWRLKFTFI